MDADVRILAGTLDDPPPARIAGDVDHRCKGPVDPRRCRLGCRDPRRALGERRVEARRLA
jgi:hypothetical protein